MENLLEKRFDPTKYQTEVKGKRILLSELSRDDILQVACESMEALERLDEAVGAQAAILDNWRRGHILPEPEKGPS
jgi:hypothetical protein